MLKAVSNYFPQIGYVQGMNFIIGFMIIVSQGNEIDTFFSFISIARNQNYLIFGLFETGLPLLTFLEFVTQKIMEKQTPKLLQHLRKLSVPIEFILNKWFMTIFLYNMNFDVCLRLWDNFITNGIFSLCSLSVSILEFFQHRVMVMKTCLEVLTFFQDIQE